MFASALHSILVEYYLFYDMHRLFPLLVVCVFSKLIIFLSLNENYLHKNVFGFCCKLDCNRHVPWANMHWLSQSKYDGMSLREVDGIAMCDVFDDFRCWSNAKLVRSDLKIGCFKLFSLYCDDVANRKCVHIFFFQMACVNRNENKSFENIVDVHSRCVRFPFAFKLTSSLIWQFFGRNVKLCQK